MRACLCTGRSSAEVSLKGREVTCSGERSVALQRREDPPPGVERERTPRGQRAVRRQPVDPEDSSAY